jgi:hypothetical protein
VRKTTKILFIGNSFTARNALAEMLSRLAASARPARSVVTQQVIANGMALKTHWDRGTARQTIRGKRWDFVVLQEQSTLPLKNRARMHEYVTLFAEEIRQHGAEPVLYMTWTRQHALDRQPELSDAYLSIGCALGAIVVPVGMAWEAAFKDIPGIRLHDRDGSHPNPAGSYLSACCFYAALFGGSPVGLEVEPTVLAMHGGEAAARSLQEVAWRTVQGQPSPIRAGT